MCLAASFTWVTGFVSYFYKKIPARVSAGVAITPNAVKSAM